MKLSWLRLVMMATLNGVVSVLIKPLKELTAQEADKQYVTPLVIWTNYEIEEKEIDRISANYLGSIVLELANLELTEYNEAQLRMREEIPALGKNGYYLADGTYVPWQSGQEYPQVMEDYRMLEYNYVADRKNRQDDIFEPSSLGSALREDGNERGER